MYQPKFNSVLVEIDDTDAAWGGGNDESMLGKSFHKGKAISIGLLVPTSQYPFESLSATHQEFLKQAEDCIGRDIIWNEGAESGTTFEEDGKLYGFIYWYDIRACRVE